MTMSLLGGLGIFLLGMVLLVDGLKALAGEALRRILTRFVAGPVSGCGWGALVTVLVQSSSASTMATVGFVSAGLLTFTQAVGVIFGANLGTTSTGWIVSQLGFKVSLGSIAPVVVLGGAFLRLLARGRLAHLGMVLAGFALLFIGLDAMQAGMAGMAARISPSDLPEAGQDAGIAGRLLLVGMGALMTILVQSSSASMAAVLAAVASGAIDVSQAAYMIVGQNVGTTPTAWIAALGAPAAAKRTALAHVLFNLFTAAGALLVLPWLLDALQTLFGASGPHHETTVLAAFHSTFNLLGVAILLPLARPFAALVERIIPDRTPRATRHLSTALIEVGAVALEAAWRALAETLGTALDLVRSRLDSPHNTDTTALRLAEVRESVLEVQRFVQRVSREQQDAKQGARLTSLMHTVDHTLRLLAALKDAVDGEISPPDRSDEIVAQALLLFEPLLASISQRLTAYLRGTDSSSEAEASLQEQVAVCERTSKELAVLRKSERTEALAQTAMGGLSTRQALDRIDALLWLDRLAYHQWRALSHLVTASGAPGTRLSQ